MAFSGGVFSRLYDWTTDRDNGVKILASRMDQEFDGIATGLSTCILKDGTQTCTAAVPFAEGMTIPDDKTLVFGTDSDVTIQYDETTNNALEIAANVEGAALGIVLKADQGDDNSDQWKVNVANGGTLSINSKISGSFVSQMTLTPNATVASSNTNVHGVLQYGSLSDGTITITQFVDEDNMASDSATMVPTQQSVKAYVDSQVTAQDFDFSGDSGGAQSVDLDSQSMTFTGGTGIDTTGSAQTLTVAIDSTVATLSGAQTLTNKSIDASQLTGTVANARLDQQLQDVAGLAVTDGNFIVGDGSNFVAESGATARTSLGLGSIATQASDNVSISGGSISGITDLAITDGGTGASSASAARTNLGLGTAATSASTDFVAVTGNSTISGELTITTANNNPQLTLTSTDADAAVGPLLDMIRDSASPADDDTLGRLRFRGDNDAGEQFTYGTITSKITDASDGTEGGLLTFLVARNGSVTSALDLNETTTVFNEGGLDVDFRVESNNSTHALFVDADGEDVCFGKNTADLSTSGFAFANITSSTNYFALTNTSSSSTAPVLYANRHSGDGQCFVFRRANSNVGDVSVTSSGTTYNTTSDRRLKTDIQPITDATDKLMQMQPVTHKWIADPDADAVHGFIAQDMQQIVPEAVSGEDGGEEMMSMDYGRITPVLVAALQEATNEIRQLKARVAELEAE